MRQSILETQIEPRTIEYLEILQEECAEVIQAISKIKRFGLDSYHPADPDKVSNFHHLIVELGDIQGMIRLLSETDLAFNWIEGGEDPSYLTTEIEKAALKKTQKVIKFCKTKQITVYFSQVIGYNTL